MDDAALRRRARLLGLAAIGFGLPMALTPRFAGRLFGVTPAADPTVTIIVRATGARELILGVGLWSAATHGGNYLPWLLARWLSDAGDATAVLLALRAGARGRRWPPLALLAGSASVYGFRLWRRARSAK